MLLQTLLVAALALAAPASAESPPKPCGPGPDPVPHLIAASWIAPRTFPNCGFAGTLCGTRKRPGGKTLYYCGPFRATCCQTSRFEPQVEPQVEALDERAEAEGDDAPAQTDEAGQPIFLKPDGRFSYCPDG